MLMRSREFSKCCTARALAVVETLVGNDTQRVERRQ